MFQLSYNIINACIIHPPPDTIKPAHTFKADKTVNNLSVTTANYMDIH